jgi:hypothetical protein
MIDEVCNQGEKKIKKLIKSRKLKKFKKLNYKKID